MDRTVATEGGSLIDVQVCLAVRRLETGCVSTEDVVHMQLGGRPELDRAPALFVG